MYCQTCGDKTPNPKFCSLSCSVKKQQEIKHALAKIPSKECLNCGIEFTYGKYSGTTRTSANKFCNRSCAATYNNTKFPKRNNPENIHITECPVCGSKNVGRYAKFCSTSCSHKHSRDEKLIKWIDGDSSVVTTSWGLSEFAREFILFSRDYSCESCGWGERHPNDGAPLVQVDHIDGDSQNNDVSNLKVLCPNCHSKTPHHGARNKGNGRAARRKMRRKVGFDG